MTNDLAENIAKRRTFAIISHPDKVLADKPGQKATTKLKNSII